MAYPAARPRPAVWSAAPHTPPAFFANGARPPLAYHPQPAALGSDQYWRSTPEGLQHFGFQTTPTMPARLPSNLGPRPWVAPPTAPKLGRRGRAWIAAGGVAASAVAVAVAVALTNNHTSAAPATQAQVQAPAPTSSVVAAPPAPSTTAQEETPVEDGDLAALLPTPNEVAAVMRVSRLASIDKLNGPGMFQDESNPAECIGVVSPDARAAYATSGVHVNDLQAWRDPDSRALSSIEIGVSTFDSGTDASAFVDQQSAIWPTCSLAPIVTNPDTERRRTWDVSDVTRNGDTLVAHLSMRHMPGRCERALTARRNVVIDTVTCSQNPDGTATALTSRVAKKLGRAT
jgi:hypothetical protein